MALDLNTYNVVPIQGQIDLPSIGNVLTGQMDAAAGSAVVPGQPVKRATPSAGLPKFLPLAANTDKTAGFVCYNPKDASYAASKPLEIAVSDAVMWMTSGAAIAAGVDLEVIYTTNKVILNAGVNPIVGSALDSASAADQLIRVKIKTPVL